MIKPGVVSVTFRKKSPREVIDIVKAAGLYAIEWGSDVHVPQGDIELAREIRNMTIDAGLEIPSYGSYYRLGTNDDFAPFLASAKALGAKNIRVWAGSIPSATITDAERENIVNNARTICDMAAKEEITISVEYHDHSMTDSADADIAFVKMVDRPNFYTYWQQPLDIPQSQQMPDLLKVVAAGRITNFHVYQYHIDEDGRHQLPLDAEVWRGYFNAINDDKTHYAFIEFVGGYPDDEFIADAKTLLSIAK